MLLINGTQLLLTAAGHGTAATVLPASMPSAQRSFNTLITMSDGGHVSDVPADALPFIGHGLDPSLFDVTALSRLEEAGRLPVLVSYRGPVPALPGVVITHAAGGTANGYLTATSATKFGAALQRQFLADHARASYGADGLFADGVSITLPGHSAPRRARPHFALHTLTIRGTNLAGQPDTGDSVTVINMDRPARAEDVNANSFFHGVTRLSVPSGRYWAIGEFTDFRNGFVTGLRLPVRLQFTVPATPGADARTSIGEQSASSQISVATSRPAAPQTFSFLMIRRSPAGVSSNFGVSEFMASSATGRVLSQSGPQQRSAIWVSPTHRKPTVGSLRSFTAAQLTSPPGPGVPYAYNVDFPGPPGLVPAQHFVVRASSLATVHERYFQDLPSGGFWATFGGTISQLNAGGGVSTFFAQPLSLPGQQIQYVTRNPTMLWSGEYWEFDGPTGILGGQSEAFHRLGPGQQLTEDWGRYPLHPQPDVILSGFGGSIFETLPSAARAGDTLALTDLSFGDNTRGHFGRGFVPDLEDKTTGHWEIDQNGRRLADGGGFTEIAPVRLSARPSVIRFTLTASRTGPHYLLSPSSTTTWTWRSRRDTAARVPAPWHCQTGASLTKGLTRRCAVQPMMTLNYQVAGMDMTGTTPGGRQVIDLTAGHLQLAAAPAITRARLQASFDGGVSWHRTQITRTGPGRFNAAFTAPPGALVTLRTIAADAAGGSITEIIKSAYQTTGAQLTAAAGPARARGSLIRPPCTVARPGTAQCFLAYRPQAAVNQARSAGLAGQAARPHGLGAQAIRSAYKLPSPRGARPTVAVSIAFHTPHLAHFLAVYRKQFGLPPCTVASGCFRQVNQAGKASPLPPALPGSGWDLEVTLDVSMISAACPHCRILVVEAKDATIGNLARTERAAARLGARVISNSYGSEENGFSLTARKAYEQPGHTIVASSGDSGYDVAQFPADLATVTSVGGTTLTRAKNARGWRERVWRDSIGAGGSGCSAYIPKPPWQHDSHCPMRTSADVSAVAASVPIFISVYGGWVTVAGTSISAPLVAGIYGLAGNGARTSLRHLYQQSRSLFDITRGDNAFLFGVPARGACGGDYLCVARKGYDAPTGLGSPDGIGAF